MNAVRTLRVPLHLLALAAAAALLTAAAILALGSAAQAALTDAQRDAQLNLSLLEDSDNIVPSGSTIRVNATITLTAPEDSLDTFGPPFYLQSGGQLRVTRGLEWADSGRSVLTLNERATSDADENDAADDGRLNDLNSNCGSSTEAQLTTWTCTLAIQSGSTALGAEVEGNVENNILIPEGTPDGPFTISGTVKINDKAGDGSAAGALTLTDTLTVTVGKVVEVATATLDFATQEAGDLALNGREGAPWPSTVSDAAGETRLRLSMLNAGGTASARNSVSQLQLTTTTGRISAITLGIRVNDAGLPTAASTAACQSYAEQRICQLDVSRLNANNSDRIIMRVRPPLFQSATTAIVRGSLLTTDGRTFSLGPLRIRFTGPAVALDIDKSAVPLRVLNAETADNDLDQLLIPVGATDLRGDQVAISRAEPLTAKLTTPGNKPIPTRTETTTHNVPGTSTRRTITTTFDAIRVDWPLLQADIIDGRGNVALDSEGRLQARITVRATAERPLESGTYKLELSAGSLKQSVEFLVTTNKVDAIAVETDANEVGLGGQVTLTATLTNAEGEPVWDGTPVTFTERSLADAAVIRTAVVNGSSMTIIESSPGPAPTVLVMNSQATQRTKDGQASVTLRAVAPGRSYITATAESGAIKGVQTITVSTVSATADAAQLSSTTANQYSVWLGSLPVRASQLLPQLTGVAALHKWTGETWLTHTTADPATDFIIDPGNTLWLSAE